MDALELEPPQLEVQWAYSGHLVLISIYRKKNKKKKQPYLSPHPTINSLPYSINK